ncbi:type VII secretion protein EssC [Shouchella clausii]|uniref:type VII secretion protein EssC n=1 Tax=Shouchella TaxID=2893057 RepID=UPI0004E6F024|nr:MULTISPECIES: type VII secretion protein EssC [Shouchella]ALA52160.1 FtsK/SpoIIIE family protein, putative secretion system component EssC/YukA [Shouchella clausii]KKI86897.1 cell division protein FtsK [Shouchella clausii]MBU3230399.1 type VII secretion protein EssC [Shouchella clausii]MBU3262402.1 type VII secretion protein EssC [Shouchella clausii]MBU3507283.1 type VII secretion protein EssC [Shouchella clausii]
MDRLWVFYDSYVQQLDLSQAERLLGASEDVDLLVPPLHAKIRAKMASDQKQCVLDIEGAGEQILAAGESFQYKENDAAVTFVYKNEAASERMYFIGEETFLSIGPEESADIVLPSEKPSASCTLIKKGGNWFAYPEKHSHAFVNGKALTNKQRLKNGDVLLLGYTALVIKEGDLLAIESSDPLQTRLARIAVPTSESKKKYPEYRRTPRIIYEEPKDRVTFSIPGQELDDNHRALWLIVLPPLAMLIVMGIVALLIPRGIFIIISATMFTVTLITSTVNYFRERKIRKQKEEKRQRVYTRYLKEKRVELQEMADKQRHVLDYHFPSFEENKYMAANLNGRIWEKTVGDDDFMHVRVGKSSIPISFQIADPGGDLANRDRDELLEEGEKLKEHYSHINDAPLSLSLASGSIGYVGQLKTVQREVAQMVGQLAFFQSYHDLRFVAVFSEEQYANWEWMKWLPHFQLPHMYAKGFIYNERTRDQLLTSIYEMVRERELEQSQDKPKRFIPHFVFLVANRSLISDHAIMEYLEGPDKVLGMSVIFLTDAQENLTEYVHTIVKVVNQKEGEIVIRERKAEHKRFTFDPQDATTNEKYARLLASLNHQRGMSRSIPEMASFLEMFGVQHTKELAIEQRWQTTNSAESLAVPVGFKAKDELLELNIHEKAHGPHGLLAGTTGSGKSEFLQTYILSLAVHYHPHEVAFLLIDYKGGGMAQPFKNIPHLLGTITNINDSKNFSMRALASIKSELRKRQRLFDQNLVNHIDDYMELYKQKQVLEPMPHLFIISDEFAELKNEEPEFIKELVSAARIGRSLGVHLILATQKPGGIIDNQIWSNARFRVALKVQDALDSKEILKNPDAANLTVTGRAYLQVGNNELYELFQSAWSGAPYLRETHEGEEDVALVTDAGLVPISNVQAATGKKQKSISEIEAVVKEIEATTERLCIQKASSPWLDPLEEWLPPVQTDTEAGMFPLALADEPEEQRQFNVHYEWLKDGNIAVFGSGGYGKSTTLMALMLQFAKAFSPEDLHFYIFDFGNGALLPFRQLPHTADYFKIDEKRKIEKAIALLKAEMDDRRERFLAQEVNSLTMYNQTATEPLPVLFMFIDNFDLIKEEYEQLESTFIQFARDGQSLGIYVSLTATRANALRQPLMNTMKTKIVHFMNDRNDVITLLGRSKYEIEPIPGRAILAKDSHYFAQMYLPEAGEDDQEMMAATRNTIADLGQRYQDAKLPEKIAMLPTQLSLASFQTRVGDPGDSIPFALDEDTVKPVFLQTKSEPHLLVVGQPRKGKTNVAKVLLNYYLQQEVDEIGLFDGTDRKLSAFVGQKLISYIDQKEQIKDWVSAVEEKMAVREQAYMDALNNGETVPAFAPVLLLIDSLIRFQQTVDAAIQDKLAKLMKNSSHLGFRLIVCGNSVEFTKGFDPLTAELKLVRHYIIVMKKSDQTLVNLSFTRNEEEIAPGFGYYVVNGIETKIKIPEAP